MLALGASLLGEWICLNLTLNPLTSGVRCVKNGCNSYGSPMQLALLMLTGGQFIGTSMKG
jgi:hypothetical protein